MNNAALIQQQNEEAKLVQDFNNEGWSQTNEQQQLSQKNAEKVELPVQSPIYQQKNPFTLNESSDSYDDQVAKKRLEDQLKDIQTEVNDNHSDQGQNGGKKDENEKQD